MYDLDFDNFFEYNKRIINEQIDAISYLINDYDIRKIALRHPALKPSQEETPFNVFKLASNKYYIENFHSDIIKAFLDPHENHKEGYIFLYVFIDFINTHFQKVCISKDDYKHVTVTREYGRIDILIKSTESKHCIIIENKIHNAGDTNRQLPKYYDLMTNEGYIVDAIVYIPLDENKRPNRSTWNDNDVKKINPLLCIVPASDAKHNLIDNWIYPCSLLSKNIDCVFILNSERFRLTV